MGISLYLKREVFDKIVEKREIWESGRPNSEVLFFLKGAPEKGSFLARFVMLLWTEGNARFVMLLWTWTEGFYPKNDGLQLSLRGSEVP